MKPLQKLRKMKGFSLIELLVVVSIIALLATGSISVYPRIMLDVKSKAAMRQAYQIHVGLVSYASGHDQVFPNEGADGKELQSANDAYRVLFSADLTDDEKLFYVQGSGWHQNKPPDGDIGEATDHYSKALEPKENHWGYVKGLTQDRSPTTLPIVMDGGAQGSPGKWVADPLEPGGCWKGKKAVVVRIGGDAKVMDLNAAFTATEKKRGSDVDIFSQEYGTKSDNLLNPAGG